MQSFCEAWKACGGGSVERKGWLHTNVARNVLKMLALMRLPIPRGKKAFLVCSRGGHLLKAAVPFLFQGEIIPMLWDCWPDTWARLERDLKLMRCTKTNSLPPIRHWAEIKAGKIVLGMSELECQLAVGKPRIVIDGDELQWQLNSSTYIFFKQGVVSSIVK